MLELYLGFISIPGSEYRVWDVVTGHYPSFVAKPPTWDTGANKTNGNSMDSPTQIAEEEEAAEEMVRGWEDADSIAYSQYA